MNGISGLTASQSAALTAMFGAFLGVTICIVIAYYLLLIISYWKIFTKAGEKGWKAIIPFYNTYTQFKLTWSTKFFWIFLILSISTASISGILQGSPTLARTNPALSFVLLFIILALAIAVVVISIISWYRLSKSFGHGGGYTVGLLFLNFIFMLILAFGSSKYEGNVYLKEKKK